MIQDGDIIVRLRIFSESLNPPEISGRIGISADRQVSPVFRTESGSQPRHEWQLDSGLSNGSLDEKVAALLRRLHHHELRVAALHDSCEIVVSCVIYGTEIPALFFSSEVVSRIAGLRAALDVDLYLPLVDQAERTDK